MKGIIYIFAFIAVIMVWSACSKPEPAENPYSRIEVTWRLIATATDENLNGILDSNEIQAVSTDPAQLLKFNYDSTGNEHVVINNTTEDYPFTWQFENTFHDVQRIITGDTITSQIDVLTDQSLYLRNYDSNYSNNTVIATWKIYSKK
jgi:hypothetical protein